MEVPSGIGQLSTYFSDVFFTERKLFYTEINIDYTKNRLFTLVVQITFQKDQYFINDSGGT